MLSQTKFSAEEANQDLPRKQMTLLALYRVDQLKEATVKLFYEDCERNSLFIRSLIENVNDKEPQSEGMMTHGLWSDD